MKKKEIYDKSWHGFIHNNILGRYVDSYLPFYDDYADYNTNAKSYYDYLARYNHLLKLYAELINRLLRRNIEVLETDSLELLKKGDWIDNGTCPPNNFDDIIKLLGNVKVSNEKKNIKIDDKTYNFENAIEIFERTGLYAPDYKPALNDIWLEIHKIWKEIEKIIEILEDHDDRINDLENLVDSIRGLDLIELEKDKDYEINFYNGFYAPDDDLVISATETKDSIDIHISDHSTSGRVLKNEGDLRDRTELSFRPGKDIPEKSKVFGIKFKGKYSYLNNLEIKVDNTQQSLWIIRPSIERASWPALLTPHNINNEIIYSWRNYADGFGNQLKNSYSEELSLTYGMVRSHIIFLKEEK